MIDPHYTDRFHWLEGLTSFAEIFSDPVKQQRFESYLSDGPAYQPPPCAVHDTTAPGPHGAVPLRVYSPPQADATGPGHHPDSHTGLRPGLVWLHGGAFVGGSLDMPESDGVARELVHRAGAVVVAVDYRLVGGGGFAPKDPGTRLTDHFPVPHDDVVAAWRWTVQHAPELGVDPARLALGGASAGGNLAVGAALHLRDDQDAVLPARILLAYPVLHATMPMPSPELTAAMADVPRVLRFLADDVDLITRTYLGGEVDPVPAYAMPAHADPAALADLARSSPITIVTCEYDDLRSSGEAFAGLLRGAGAAVDAQVEAGVLHGHLNESPRLAGTDHTLGLFAQALR